MHFAKFQTDRGSDTNDVICARDWLLRRHSRCCPSASCRFEPRPLQTHIHSGYTTSNYFMHELCSSFLTPKHSSRGENGWSSAEQLSEGIPLTDATTSGAILISSCWNSAGVVLTVIVSALWFSHTNCCMFLCSGHVILHCKVRPPVPL